MRRWIAAAVTALSLTTAAPAAHSGFWFGKIDLVQKPARAPVRFLVRSQGLSLYARGDVRTILLRGFFAKAVMSIGYRPIACPASITGQCGRVDFVSVDQSGLP
jgi:hypothetical protein